MNTPGCFHQHFFNGGEKTKEKKKKQNRHLFWKENQCIKVWSHISKGLDPVQQLVDPDKNQLCSWTLRPCDAFTARRRPALRSTFLLKGSRKNSAELRIQHFSPLSSQENYPNAK